MASSNVTSVTSHFSQSNEGFITTLGTTVAIAGTVVDLASVTGLTDGSVFVGIIEPGGVKEQTFTGVVDVSGTQITGVKWTRGTNVEHTAGVTIVDYVTGTGHNMMTKGLLVSHNQDGTLKTSVLTTLLDGIYPVGSIYTNASVSTNPATLLSFGTWTAFGTGQVLVGVDAGQTEFDTLGETGGEKTHTLTTAELAAHSHTASTDSQGNHSHSLTQDPVVTSGGGSNRVYTAGGGQQLAWSTGVVTSTTGAHTHTVTVNNAGSGTAHNNLQPYITVYMWKRTA